MVVGVPKETKVNEYRVAVTPDGVSELVHHGSTVVIETGAGVGAAITDEEYLRAGAQIA
ncbi:MAG TPA: alanine dehydrogenase, partial [Acidimicrobiia bacterium]|nr:alanine dehydrogenase [Acidimicrobiia bacterium]